MGSISLRRFMRAVDNPRLVVQHLNAGYHRMRNGSYYDGGTDFLAEDWDNLIILDACRYDTFREINDIDGTLEKKTSRASSTIGFLHANLSGRQLHDVVYLTANPQLKWKANQFETNLYKTIHVWEDEGWDEEAGTVFPETVTKRALDAAESYENKRLIVHYLQPHCPFIGERGTENFAEDSIHFWAKVRKNEIQATSEQLWMAYKENLSVVLESVRELLEGIDGKSVVTSDHGQLIGERSAPIPIREYGHPRTTYVDELVEVPWLIVDGERREITEDTPVKSSDLFDQDDVKRRLTQLGYA